MPHEPTLEEMEAVLDGYIEATDISAFSPAAQGFIVQTYFIVKRLIGDVETLRKRLDAMDDYPQYKMSVN